VPRKELIRKMVAMQSKYQPTSLGFGEQGRREQNLKKEMAQLTSSEQREVRNEVEKRKFLILKNLFESYYR